MVSLVMTGVTAVLATTLWQTPQQTYFEWTDLPFPADEYVTRRARMTEEIRSAGGGLYLAPSGQGRSHGETFRPLNDFLYFTGLELPNAMFVLDATSGEGLVFVANQDPRFASATRKNDFPGRALADDPTLARRTGLTIRPFDELAEFLRNAHTTLRVNVGSRGQITPSMPAPIHDWTAEDGVVAWLASAHHTDLHNAYEQVASVRMIKSDREITLMRETAQITMRGIRHAATFIRPGVDERRLEGELEASYKRAGSQRMAFASIIKSGPNSLWPWRILASHYDRRNRVMESGDLVIFDVGAELDYYISDVGRTFPVSGTFSPRQREILEMEVAVSDAIIAAIRPGVTFADLQRVADSAIPPDHKQYMQTGLFFGHHLGLDTGDPSLSDVTLKPGMIFTVEPWYYNHEEGISVFTEDEVLVTSTGVEVLTAALPRRPEELERMIN